MKSAFLKLGWLALVLPLLFFSACSKEDDDPAADDQADGTVAATCTSSLNGTGTLNVGGNTNLANRIVTGTCAGLEYVAAIGSDAGAIAIQFKGLPNAGTFLIRNPADYASSTAKNVVYIAAGDDNGTTGDYVSGSSGNLKVTVEKVGNNVRIILPRVTVTQVVGGGSIQVEADFTINY